MFTADVRSELAMEGEGLDFVWGGGCGQAEVTCGVLECGGFSDVQSKAIRASGALREAGLGPAAAQVPRCGHRTAVGPASSVTVGNLNLFKHT